MNLRLLYLSLIILLHFVSANKSEAQSSKLSRDLTAKINQAQAGLVNEQVYLHIDRRSYQSGEELWFKAYILNNQNYKLSFLSKVLTIGLLDEAEQEVFETSFEIKSGRASGGINLPENLPTGNYVLYAYSGWMKKYDDSAIFYTQLQIENKDAYALRAQIEMDKEGYQPGEGISFTILVTDDEDEPIKKEELTFEIIDRQQVFTSQKTKTDKDGSFALSTELPGEHEGVLKVKVSNDALGSIGESIIPLMTYGESKVEAFPEGGQLISGSSNTVAFKVSNFFNDPIDVRGKLMDDNGQEILEFQSFYGGMGKFEFTPEEGRSYTVVTEVPVQTSTLLPQSSSIPGLKLVSATKDTLTFEVIGQNTSYPKLEIIGLMNSKLHYSSGNISGSENLKVPLQELPQGIAQFTLFSSGKPISERLVYVNRHKLLKISSSLDIESMAPKSAIELEVMVVDREGKPVKGNFSMAVADEYFSRIGGQYHASIMANMYLSTELKGKIPTPNYYFGSNNSYTNTALDLLMLTHGWRRYNWDYFLSEKSGKPEQNSQNDVVMATVTDKKGRPVSGAEIQIVNTTNFSAEIAMTDNNGQFIVGPHLIPQLENIYFKTPLESHEVTISKASGFLTSSLSSANPWESYYESNARNPQESDYFGDDYEVLSGIVINSSRLESPPVDISEKYELTNQMSVKSHYLVESRTVDELFYDIPTISSPGNPNGGGFVDIVKQVTNIYAYNGMTGQLLLRPPSQAQFPERWGAVAVLNGSLVGKDFRALNHLNSSTLEKVEVIKTSAMAIYYGSIAANGAVLVTTKKGEIRGEQPTVQQPERITLKISKEYYAPQYDDKGLLDNGASGDYRKTLHWVSSFNTDDEGKAIIPWFNDQAPKTATIIIQGTDGIGNFGYYVDQYAVQEPE